MPHSLPAILAHVRAQGRSSSHQAVLVREIERLRTALRPYLIRDAEAVWWEPQVSEPEAERLKSYRASLREGSALASAAAKRAGASLHPRIAALRAMLGILDGLSPEQLKSIRGATKETTDV